MCRYPRFLPATATRTWLLLASMNFLSLTLSAQTAATDTTIERLRRRSDFAKMYVGLDYYQNAGGTTGFRAAAGAALQPADFAGSSSVRVLMGATHFWGHADFYIAIPVVQHQLPYTPPAGLRSASLLERVETGVRVFPWAVEPGRLRPFVGASFKPISFAQADQSLDPDNAPAPYLSRIVFPLQVGLWYANKHTLWQLAVNYRHPGDLRYPVSRTDYGPLSLAPWSVNAGISYWFNTNASMASPGGVRLMKYGPKKLSARHRLNSWYAGIGPSASFEISKSDYVKANHPYLVQSIPNSILPDITAGRYFHKLDANVGLSYRGFSSSSAGYGTRVGYNRRSYMLEVYKFLGDYHGFVPYIGPTLAYEDLTFSDTDGNQTRQFQEGKLAVGLIFGWDIRLSRAEAWLLRTNLRYTPNLHLTAEGKRVMFDQLEFNFIQFVWFFGRQRALRS